MRTDDALAALGAGLWSWDSSTGLVTLDTRAARLLGVADQLPAEADGGPATAAGGPADTHVTLSGTTVRSHLHAVDYVGFQGIVTLALAEEATAEALLRVVDQDGAVLRTVRVVVRPAPLSAAETASDTLPGPTTGPPSGPRPPGATGPTAPGSAAPGPSTPDAPVPDSAAPGSSAPGGPPAPGPSAPSPAAPGTSAPGPSAPSPSVPGTAAPFAGAPGLTGLVYEVPEAESGAGAPSGRRGEGAAAPLGPGARAAAADRNGAAAAEWDWRRNREAFLLDAGRALAEAYTTADVLRVAASLAMPGFSPDALAVFCVSGDQLTVYGASPGAPARPGYPYGPGGAGGPLGSGARLRLSDDDPAAEAVRTGRPIYLLGPDEYAARFPAARPAETQPGRSAWAFLPLTVAGRTIGAWMAAFARPVAFTPDERAVLTTVARMLAQSLSRAMLGEAERELSARLQRAMRPAHSPAIPGMDLAARYVPTGGGLQIGGDWYDVIPLPSGRTALVIGDVQGHDVRAAGIMGQLRVAVRAYASEGHHPDAVLSRASRFLHGMSTGERLNAPPPSAPVEEAAGLPAGPGPEEDEADYADPRFATCLYVEVDPATGTLDVARAGHPDPAVQLPDGPLMVRPTAGGLPLGVEPDSDYPVTRLVLEPGERLLMCTDGLLEAGGLDQEAGWTRINEVVEDLRNRTAARPRTDAGTAANGAGAVPTGTGAAGARPGLEQVADALVRAAHGGGGAAYGFTGTPAASHREDDIALLLLARTPAAEGAPAEGAPASARRTVMTIAQAQPDRIAAARHQLRDLLHDWCDPEQVDGAVLMLSEMLTNVLVHTDGDALLVAQITAPRQGDMRTLRVNVSDSSDELPHRRSPGELASSGRGLMLLGMLADRWGVDPRGEGKCIWFEMHEAEPSDQDGTEAAEPSLDQWDSWDLSAADEG